MKEFKLDIGIASLSKHREEVCGDSAIVVKTEEATTIILSDGLGSGIKASILSILTTRISAGLLKRKVALEQVFATIADTLPTCKVRNLAYATLAILKIDHNGQAHLIEYDTPPLILMRQGKAVTLERCRRQIGSKEIAEAFFAVEIGDRLLLMSDGVVNAGVGGIYKLGLGGNGVVTNLQERGLVTADAQVIADQVVNLVDACYLCCPDDDATTVALAARPPRTAVVLTGPPARPEDDRTLIDYFLHYQGEQRIVCGGATGNLVARETGNPIKTSLEYIDPSVPPTAEIAGIDLVTEGILTLNKCIEKLRVVVGGGRLADAGDGATRLAHHLLWADRIVFLVGAAVNPAHETFMHSLQLVTRSEAVNALVDLLGTLEKEVLVEQF